MKTSHLGEFHRDHTVLLVTPYMVILGSGNPPQKKCPKLIQVLEFSDNLPRYMIYTYIYMDGLCLSPTYCIWLVNLPPSPRKVPMKSWNLRWFQRIWDFFTPKNERKFSKNILKGIPAMQYLGLVLVALLPVTLAVRDFAVGRVEGKWEGGPVVVGVHDVQQYLTLPNLW